MSFGNFANVMTTESGKNLINDVVISGDCSIEMPKNGRKVAHKTTRRARLSHQPIPLTAP
ncbi:TPA: hypothetical protein ACPKDB_001687 [Haemophilus influenzae]